MKYLLGFILLLLAHVDVIAQGCSTCTATANNLDAKSAQGLNAGILYLAATPLLFLGAIALIWYKKYKS